VVRQTFQLARCGCTLRLIPQTLKCDVKYFLIGVKLDVKSCEALEEIFKRVRVHMLDIENTNLEDEVWYKKCFNVFVQSRNSICTM
jgi:hypothetical protein